MRSHREKPLCGKLTFRRDPAVRASVSTALEALDLHFRATAGNRPQEDAMAKYGRKASQKVERAMKERKRGTLRSGRSGKKVTSRKQAIAIGLSEARRAGAKVPRKKGGSRKRTGGSRKRSSTSRKK
jgi:hypothetical protein